MKKGYHTWDDNPIPHPVGEKHSEENKVEEKKIKEAITGSDRKILFILIREIVRNLKPKIKNMDVNNKSHINRVGSSILGIIRAMTYSPDNANYKNFKKYFPKQFNSKLVQKKLKQFHSQNDKVQVTLVTQAIKNELSEGKLTEKYKTPKMSKKDWRKIAKFKKHIGQDGTHYITKLDRKLGTILVPVIVEEKLTEKEFIPTVTIEFTRDNRGKGRTEVKKFKTIADAKKYTRQMNKKYKLKRQKGFWGNPVNGIELFHNFS